MYVWGNHPTGVPEAQPLTCFSKSFALVSVSSTSRFTPKAPGFSGFKIYRQEGKQLSGTVHISSLSVRSSTACPGPPNFPAAGRVSISFFRGVQAEEMAQKAEERFEGEAPLWG